MNMVGKWKVAEVPVVTEQGLKYISLQEKIDMCESEDEKSGLVMMAEMIMEFYENGRALTYVDLPENMSEDEILDAIERGMKVTEDHKAMIFEEHDWREENGEIFFDTKVEGETSGEIVSSWQKLQEDENGLVTIMMSKFTRV